MKELNILYTVDKNYYKHMLVSMYSLATNNKDLNIHFHIIENNLNKNIYSLIENTFSNFNNITINYYDFNLISDLIDKYNIPKWRNSGVANARLFFDKFIKDCNNLLYLDSDTIIVNSLKNIEKYNDTIHMVKDSVTNKHMKDIHVNSYYNSGVIWIDLNKWHENNCTKKIIDTLACKPKLMYPDQDLLNIALKDDIKAMNLSYNLVSNEYYFNSFFLERFYKQNDIRTKEKLEIIEAKKNPIILHATPFYLWRSWDNNGIHPYKKIYNHYYAKIFNSIIEENNPSKDLLLKLFVNTSLIVPKNIKQKIKKIVRK